VINNPIIPNPVFETLPPPWQLITLDAWTASVNQSIGILYSDPSSFNATVSDPTQTIIAGATSDVIFPVVNFQTSDGPYNNVTGIFTAAAPGIYRFEVSLEVVWPTAPGSAQAWLSLNGSLQNFPGSYFVFVGSTNVNNGGSHDHASVTIRMNQNDTVRVKMTNTGGTQLSIGLPGQGIFTGI